MSDNKKRGNYEGSKPKQRKDGRFQVNIRLPDVGRKSFYGKTKTEAQQKARKAVQMAESGQTLPNERMTVGKFLAQWIVDKRPTVRLKTWVRYEEIVRLHLVPALGREKLLNLKWQTLDRFYATKLEAGLSPRTVRHIRRLMCTALEDAIRADLVRQNAAKLSHPVKLEEIERPILTKEEARHLMQTAAEIGDRLTTLYLLALCSTAREGELLALQWKDVDWEKGRIWIDATLHYIHGKFSFDPPKTKKGRRWIELPPVAMAALKAHKTRQDAERAECEEQGVVWGDEEHHDLVFGNTMGRPIAVSNMLRRSFHPLLKKAGLQKPDEPPMHFHDLRHTGITFHFEDGNYANMIAMIAGHHDAGFTERVYGHARPGRQTEAVETMERIFGINGVQKGGQKGVTNEAEI